jgi:hypothetical protein
VPKQKAPAVDLTEEQYEEVIKWADKFGLKQTYMASRGGMQIMGVVYRKPAFDLSK